MCRRGAIDPERVGLLWIGVADGLKRIVRGAGALVDRGIPIVLEVRPAQTAGESDAGAIAETLRAYTHLVDLRRSEVESGRTRFELRPARELPSVEDALRDESGSSASGSTHVLLLRLDASQVRAGSDLARFAKRAESRLAQPLPKRSGSQADADRERRRQELVVAQVERAVQIRSERLVDASQPLVLISQMQRSGGTLLNQLFDGHPQLHVWPPEMKLGGGRGWPVLDPTAGPEAWWRELQDPDAHRALARGYRTDRVAQKLGNTDQLEAFPHLLVESLQERLFHALVADRRPEQPRGVLDCFMTSYFNAWIDNQNLYAGPKRWIVGFRGRLSASDQLNAFFRDYPDGRHVTCVRDPVERAASKLMYRRGSDVAPHVEAWCKRTAHQLEVKERFGDRVFLVLFDRLVTDTAAVARALAAWLGIDFDPILVEPTFNRTPIKANSSFAIEGAGIRPEAREHWRTVFDEATAADIRRRTHEVYARAQHLADPI